MPKFRVERGHTIDVWVEVIVEAEDPDDAVEKLEDLICRGVIGFHEGDDQDGHFTEVYEEEDDQQLGLVWGEVGIVLDNAEETVIWHPHEDVEHPFPLPEISRA